ncbi:MAG: hemolysin family protein, partial [Acidobacteriota bacterium]
LMGAAGMSVLIAAFGAAAETSLVYSNKANLSRLAESGNRRATAALELVEERERLHAVLLLAENFFIVLSAVLGTIIAMHAFTYVSVAALVTVIAVSAIVVFIAKLVPKGLACRNPDGFSLVAAPTLKAAVALLAPVARLMAGAADMLAGPGPQGVACAAAVTEEDIKAMINLGEERGSLKEEEKELLHKVFEFGDTLASQAMRPRTEIVSIPSNATLQEVFALVSEFGFSRYPVIEDTVDTVIGTLYIKDILVAMAAGEVKREDAIRPFIRQAYFIPENKRVSELLSEMQRERFQLAIVIDEYGGTAGLVTLEDLIEEIVGSIHDELEAEQKDVQIVDEKNFVVSGQSALDEVNELLGTDLQSTDFNTIGGFVFGLFGRMPKAGEQLRYRNLKLEVLEVEGRKISQVKITKL